MCIHGFTSQFSRSQIHVAGEMTQPVLGLGDGSGTEGVGFHDIGTRCEVLGVDVANDIGA